MKGDKHGVSQCPPGEESWEEFQRRAGFCGTRTCVQYDYRTPDGELFSTVAPSLEDCRARRDKWLAKRLEHAE